jgi:flagellin-like hook-associated protein FlgL
MIDPLSGVIFNQLLNTINRNRSGLQDSLQRISSGRKLNQTGTPNPAANALSTQLKSDISALTQSVRRARRSHDLVNRLRQIAIQSSNGN